MATAKRPARMPVTLNRKTLIFSTFESKPFYIRALCYIYRIHLYYFLFYFETRINAIRMIGVIHVPSEKAQHYV